MNALPAIVSIIGLISSRRQQQPIYQMQGLRGGTQQAPPQASQPNQNKFGTIGGFLDKAGNVANTVGNIYNVASTLGNLGRRQQVQPYQMKLNRRR